MTSVHDPSQGHIYLSPQSPGARSDSHDSQVLSVHDPSGALAFFFLFLLLLLLLLFCFVFGHPLNHKKCPHVSLLCIPFLNSEVWASEQ